MDREAHDHPLISIHQQHLQKEQLLQQQRHLIRPYTRKYLSIGHPQGPKLLSMEDH